MCVIYIYFLEQVSMYVLKTDRIKPVVKLNKLLAYILDILDNLLIDPKS